MADGITADEANDRLNVFQQKFDSLLVKFNDLLIAEELFLQKKSTCDDLNNVKLELDMMQVLYLY